MAMKFSASEIFDIAVQIEQNGVWFYRQAANQGSAKALQKELLDLAQMEEDHIKTFLELKEELIGAQTDPAWFDPDSLAVRYLQAFAQGNVFNMTADAGQALAELPTVTDILTFAIEREWDSIVFYVGVKEMTPKKLGRDKIEAIINEEMSHVALLNNKLEGQRP